MRLGIVGYGAGGRYFHAPFVQAADGVELVGIVARSADKKAQVEAELPGVPTFDSLTDLLAAGVDAVTITTPPQTRHDLVLEAIAAGVHVVADKPFAPTAAAAAELADAADEAGVVLGVYHNRRFDTDIRTLAAVVAGGELGDLWRFYSRFDLDEPGSIEAGPDGGLLRDMGTHVVDQAIWLLGDVAEVSAELDWIDLPEGRTDAGFAITLRHTSGVTSYVSSSKANHVAARQLLVYGSGGSYESNGTDVQAAQIFSGRRPAADKDGWGYEDESRWGVLRTAAGDKPVPSEQGAYFEFYEQFAAAVRGEGPVPSDARAGVRTLAVLDAARRSAEQGGWQAPVVP
ncbi:Gfo/Idh/MocA family oxidoreductase [Frondihabitans cladoniiphilus]|uniref:Gfo/Idh/MocA family oxidoreductase n=1 Tax=Frondihabitans cladoniiphilus TaxID=715785 RepID=A0ABP8W1M5_9MICO